MSISAQIVTLFLLVQHKIENLNIRLDDLEAHQLAKTHLDAIQPLLDQLGCNTQTYCLPDLCNGEHLPTFPFPTITPDGLMEFEEIPDVPLPPKFDMGDGGGWGSVGSMHTSNWEQNPSKTELIDDGDLFDYTPRFY